MKIRVEFECDVYSIDYQTWFEIYNEINKTQLECIQNVKVFNAEINKEV